MGRPRRPSTAAGRHRVAVVLPTNTWQAYNRRDVDGDGTATHGTRALRSIGSTCAARSSTKACHRTSAHTTAASFTGSRRPTARSTTWRTTTSSVSEAATALARSTTSSCSPATGVRDHARLRRARAVPRPRRQPRLPLGEQRLLPVSSGADGGSSGRAAGATSAARKPRSSVSSTFAGTRTGTERALRRHGRAARSVALPQAPGLRTATGSARSGSRSTHAPRTRRAVSASSPGSPTSSAPAARPR